MKRWLPVAVLALLGGALYALYHTRSPGYGVPYAVITAFFIGALAVVAGLVLLIFRATRRAGTYGILFALIFVPSFVATLTVAKRLGAWDEPMVQIGTDRRANLVVLFRPGTTDEQIASFVNNVIGVRTSRGIDLLPGVQSLLKITVRDHAGYAIGFHRDVTAEEKASIRKRLDASPIVLRVYENVEPTSIVPPPG